MLNLDVHYLLTEPVGTTRIFHIEEGQLQLDDDLIVAFLQGEIECIRTDYGLFAQGEIATQVEVQCVRCLASIPYPLTIQLADRFAYNPCALDQALAPAFPILNKGTIDLAPALREHMLLSLPLHPLCRPDCRGLCSQCGADLNEGPCGCSQEETDPRLAMLKELLR